MNRARYDTLINNANVKKSDDHLDFQCITSCGRYNIGVYYNPTEMEGSNAELLRNKAFLGVFPNVNISTCDKPVLIDEILFLMYSDQIEYAFTFRLTMNGDKGEAFLKALDLPETNAGILCEQDIKGIFKTIHPAHRQFIKIM